MKLTTLAASAAFLIAQPAVDGKDITFLKGDHSIFKGDASFLVEFDLSNTSIDGLDTEEAFVEYKKTQKEDDAEKWESGWNTDKGNFPTYFSEAMARGVKNTRLKFSTDDPESKYRMIVRPVHIETGTPMKYSSTELKLHVVDMATNEEVAVIYLPPSRGTQMGPMTPTVGMRVNYALYGSANMLSGYIKKMLKGK